MKKLFFPVVILWFTCASCLWSQSYQQKICDVFTEDGPAITNAGAFSFSTDFSASGSEWEVDWSESYIFKNLLQYVDPVNPERSYEMRMGKGGQVYSFKGDFGEALPPQWRNRFNEDGNALPNSTSGVDTDGNVVPHYGNWAPWNDEVWQIVGSDQNDQKTYIDQSGNDSIRSYTQNIHQAGPYMNNYAHRASDLTEAPYYSPTVQSFYDESEQAYTSIIWGQSENPAYVYDSTGCNPCFPDPFRPSTLFYLRYKNLGEGVIQADFLIFNYHRTRKIGFWGVPWAGIRHSVLPYAFISDDFNDPGSYENLDHPLPVWTEGATRNTNQTCGWFAFSTVAGGSGPALAFVTAKTSGGGEYNDMRWGTALGPDDVRDLTIFSRRHIPGPSNLWELVGGESIRGRYFIVIDESVDAVVDQIENKNLTEAASVEKFTFSQTEALDIHYAFTTNDSGDLTVSETTAQTSDLTVKQKPFLGSFPVYLIKTESGATKITANPYCFSLRPYDGTVTTIELLGFTATEQDIDLISAIDTVPSDSGYKVYPNPTGSVLFVESEIKKIESFSMYDVNGKELNIDMEITDNDRKKTVDVGALSNGMYFIFVNGEKFRIVKQ